MTKNYNITQKKKNGKEKESRFHNLDNKTDK